MSRTSLGITKQVERLHDIRSAMTTSEWVSDVINAHIRTIENDSPPCVWCLPPTPSELAPVKFVIFVLHIMSM